MRMRRERRCAAPMLRQVVVREPPDRERPERPSTAVSYVLSPSPQAARLDCGWARDGPCAPQLIVAVVATRSAEPAASRRTRPR